MTQRHFQGLDAGVKNNLKEEKEVNEQQLVPSLEEKVLALTSTITRYRHPVDSSLDSSKFHPDG